MKRIIGRLLLWLSQEAQFSLLGAKVDDWFYWTGMDWRYGTSYRQKHRQEEAAS